MSRALKGSLNYIWWEKDELGKGATARVYKCREKKTGDVYAVKVYQPRYPNDQVSVSHQEREFALLKKLKHENVVKMFAIEEESQSTSQSVPTKVIVMEYCNGGSLYSILEKPENAYGLEEKEFLLFLKHITKGLKYLREENIVHRDIKPGNIMKLVTPEGRSIYKLTDFGAARALEQQDESFTSMYGTEEYLHPDLYDRAVIRKQFGKRSFTSNIDLWSVGATIYHVATGNLPFRPYGGRRNREAMHTILKDKRHGVISGVQESPKGRIIYKEELPSTCILSKALQMLLVPLIAGLLEVDVSKCMPFEAYFDYVSDIVNRVEITVFNACHASVIKVFASPTDQLSVIKDLIEQQTGFPASEQLLLYENSELDDLTQGPDSSADRFPVTSEDNPVFLYHCVEYHEYADQYPRKADIPKFPRLGTTYNLEADYALAKNCTGIMLFVRRRVKYCLTVQSLLDRAVKSYENYLIRTVKVLKDSIDLVINMSEAVKSRYEFVKSLTMLPNIKSYNPTMISRMPQLQHKLDEIRMMVMDLQRYGMDYKEKLADRKELSQKWKKSNGCNRESCLDRITSLAQNVENCRKEFENDKKMKSLPYNEEQIHKFEKNKMSTSCTQATSLLEEDCWANTKKMFHYFLQTSRPVQNPRANLPTSWFQMAYKIRTKCIKLDSKMAKLKSLCSELSEELKQPEFQVTHIISVNTTPSPSSGMSMNTAGTAATSGFHELVDTESASICSQELLKLSHILDRNTEILSSTLSSYGIELPDIS